MYGNNAIASPRTIADGFLVHSMFYTIQGEGPWAGYPAIFVRFSGCNLRCVWCDTAFEEGERFSSTELIDRLLELSEIHNCKRFVLTGGEPMLQEIGLLICSPRTVRAGVVFQIETAGTVWPKSMDDVTLGSRSSTGYYIVCSPKTPNVHQKIAAKVSAWKYIIKYGEVSADDGLPDASTQINTKRAQKLFRGNGVIYVQPCDENDELLNEQNMKEALSSALKFGYRISLQLHKYLGVD